MCYHTSLTASAEELERHFDISAAAVVSFRPLERISAFRHPEYPVVTSEGFALPRWGLIPFWIKSYEDVITLRNRTVVAPAERLFSSPLFRIPIRRRRCLVPVSGFYGWRHERYGTERYHITLRSRRIFSLAGIHDCWHCRTTDTLHHTFSIITTEANALMRHIDNATYRMPVILRREDESLWLDKQLRDTEIEALLQPYATEEMACRPTALRVAVPQL